MRINSEGNKAKASFREQGSDMANDYRHTHVLLDPLSLSEWVFLATDVVFLFYYLDKKNGKEEWTRISS